MNKILIYTSQQMTGRMCDEMRVEADMLVRVGENYGFEILNPVIEENISYEHKLLENVPQKKLEQFWQRDKEMIRESDILVDYFTHNLSDGSNNEVAYNRWCLWKPTIRVWVGKGGLISKIEDDIVVPTYVDALKYIEYEWGTYEKLGKWRKEMLKRCIPKWIAYQESLIKRYKMEEL